ncbi:GTP cyclohydrolase II [Novosphingobium nitrogenifigens DSM 19370]|uniref:GTP cyclohydrolase-2 n=1 Tax=Novosphingobium nitrogenifigens DSM 19370 TaxID=983920 RepID=F1ZCD1_9SPHN|nr:GTP cyclohydrolase II [Novosphingobium nitrogenifigens]EGD57662.1 GTP cyclohydrolase II [Novosphingobium nitrogenifigens DSM 19370]
MNSPVAARRTAQALDALRHGWAIRVEPDDGDPARAFDLLPAETGFAQPGLYGARMLISAARAATLKLANLREFSPEAPVLIRGHEPFSLAAARDLADPARDLDSPLRGPFRADPLPDPLVAATAMELARLAGILPAYLVASGSEVAVTVTPSDLAAFRDPVALTIQTRARLPVAAAQDAQIIAFRARDDLREHVALIIGDQDHDKIPLVRLHSECLTGDILGSLKCDCGPQLDAALRSMADEAAHGGWGILLYLRQEGRGIGLINKLRAYQLQDQGFDTVDANERLGLPSEARDFPVAARMLDLLGVGKVRLMTNNPAKVTALKAVGVDVVERVPHQLPSNPHNHRYLETKRDRTGHILR